MNFKSNIEKIAASKKPFAVIVTYSVGDYEKGDVVSCHGSYDLAKSAEAKNILGRNGFFEIRDARDYVNA